MASSALEANAEQAVFLDEEEYVDRQIALADRRLCEALKRRETKDFCAPIIRRLIDLVANADRIAEEEWNQRCHSALRTPGVTFV